MIEESTCRSVGSCTAMEKQMTKKMVDVLHIPDQGQAISVSESESMRGVVDLGICCVCMCVCGLLLFHVVRQTR